MHFCGILGEKNNFLFWTWSWHHTFSLDQPSDLWSHATECLGWWGVHVFYIERSLHYIWLMNSSSKTFLHLPKGLMWGRWICPRKLERSQLRKIGEIFEEGHWTCEWFPTGLKFPAIKYEVIGTKMLWCKYGIIAVMHLLSKGLATICWPKLYFSFSFNF